MAKKSALQKIEDHEKLCRIMQKQTFEQIKEMQRTCNKNGENDWIGGAIILALIMNMIHEFNT